MVFSETPVLSAKSRLLQFSQARAVEGLSSVVPVWRPPIDGLCRVVPVEWHAPKEADIGWFQGTVRPIERSAHLAYRT
jgi:hypothetical protein